MGNIGFFGNNTQGKKNQSFQKMVLQKGQETSEESGAF